MQSIHAAVNAHDTTCAENGQPIASPIPIIYASYAQQHSADDSTYMPAASSDALRAQYTKGFAMLQKKSNSVGFLSNNMQTPLSLRNVKSLKCESEWQHRPKNEDINFVKEGHASCHASCVGAVDQTTTRFNAFDVKAKHQKITASEQQQPIDPDRISIVSWNPGAWRGLQRDNMAWVTLGFHIVLFQEFDKAHDNMFRITLEKLGWMVEQFANVAICARANWVKKLTVLHSISSQHHVGMVVEAVPNDIVLGMSSLRFASYHVHNKTATDKPDHCRWSIQEFLEICAFHGVDIIGCDANQSLPRGYLAKAMLEVGYDGTILSCPQHGNDVVCMVVSKESALEPSRDDRVATVTYRALNNTDMGWKRDDRDAHGLLYLHVRARGCKRHRNASTRQAQRQRREQKKGSDD